jgi:hypothetical protein
MATNVNLYVDQGIDYSITIDAFNGDGTELNLDGTQTFFCKAKKVYSSTSAFDIAVTVDVNDGDPNNANLNITAATTVNIKPGKYNYDLVIDNGSTKTKIMEGLLTILPTVSV